MTTRSLPPVAENQLVHLVRWRVYRLVTGGEEWDILNGWDCENACGRCSTPVVQVDISTQTVLTRSGRRYVLDGCPGFDDDARYVFEARFGPSNVTGVARVDVTDAYCCMVGRVDLQGQPGSRAIKAIVQKAEQTFGDIEKARRWLSSGNAIFGDMPLALVGSKDGRRRVYEELVRIHFGDFS